MNDRIDYTKTSLLEVYGQHCFSDAVMRERLPGNVYRDLKAVQLGTRKLSGQTAEVVANAMKDWAIERGATHFTHWFQPLTGLTAEKHDSFISPMPDGSVLLEFSGKELIQGEPDASSFPNGGLRATFEARGYTAWDTSSPAVIKDVSGVKTLVIPTAFISYTGEALDKKVPLLRSMSALNTQALRVLRALGNTSCHRVFTHVGPEQEYFLIDEAFYHRRPDLRLCGRTVFGAMSPKGQQMEDHYFGAIKERIGLFMKELNYELWRLGISAKTQHNEVAPNQFEIATVFESANISTDTNQLLMEMIKNIARHHHLVALLHEKPFAGVNGSGKHNNWSIATDDGQNLLKPGDSPGDNVQFLLFLTAVIAAVDQYGTLLRLSAATSGNDHRLGADEAPPAVVSLYLGQALTDILDAIAEDRPLVRTDGKRVELGLTTIPSFPLDDTDRNRTSPFAFTGNKFEFRMVGSSQSLAGPNTMLNVAVSEVLSQVADRLEASEDTLQEVKLLIRELYKKHKRIVFNGNGYALDWIEEAQKRGLPNLTSSVDALTHLDDPQYIKLCEKHGVFSAVELKSRKDIYLRTYAEQLHIEATVMVRMARQMAIPAAMQYLDRTLHVLTAQQNLSWEPRMQRTAAQHLSEECEAALQALDRLESHLAALDDHALSALDHARYYRDVIVGDMQQLRVHIDILEELTDASLWPYPSYENMLFHL